MPAPYMAGLRCMRCGREYPAGSPAFTCDCRPNTGSDVGTLDVLWDYAAIRRDIDPKQIASDPDSSIGRFWPLLPIVQRDSLPPLPVGGTPLLGSTAAWGDTRTEATFHQG